nr:hypothetical protein [Deltaproteobacteria bacterium]
MKSTRQTCRRIAALLCATSFVGCGFHSTESLAVQPIISSDAGTVEGQNSTDVLSAGAADQLDARVSAPADDALPEEGHVTQTRPSSAGMSPVGALLQRSGGRTGARVRDGLRYLSQAELEEYGELRREASFAREGRLGMRGTHVLGAETPTQRSALDRLASAAGGQLSVAWDDIHGGPSDVENLLFVRRELDAQGVWNAFLDAHYDEVSQIWGFDSRADLVLSGTSGLGDEVTVLHGERLREGLPVDGEFIEAFVSTASSRLGPGVLTRIKVITNTGRAERPNAPREQWIAADRATSIADRHLSSLAISASDRTPNDARVSAQLRWSCSNRCAPYWHVGYRSGWSVTVGAVDGEVLQAHRQVDRYGPARMPGLPPGVSRSAPVSQQTIRFRSANVVNPADGSSYGNTYVDGTHNFTQSLVQIGLEGPVGSSNPAHYGRVERQDINTNAPVPLRVAWNPAGVPAFNFGDPNASWAANPSSGQYPRSTALLFGWFTYWQAMVRDHLSQEVTQRFAFLFNSVGALACGGSDSGNFNPPDLNGSTSWASVFCAAGATDDVGTAYDTDGDAIISAAHEFGHTVQNCASQSGAGCKNLNPSTIPVNLRPPASSWRPDIWDASRDPVAQLLGAALPRYRYLSSNSPTENYAGSWTYTSYDSTTDDFGTWSQDAGSTLDCPGQVTCGAGFVCAAADGGYNGVSPNGGLCARTCTTDANCQRGLRCQNWPIRPSGSALLCKPDAYVNHFMDTMGTRLVFTAGWRDALAGVLYSTGGQSNNATRDFVLGTDSYYSRLLNNSVARHEVTRAVSSVYSGTGFVSGDDYPDYWWRGTAIPVRSNIWTKLWWGNGSGLYPKLEDNLDADVILFHGVAGSSYRLETWFKDTAGSPNVEIALLDNLGTYWSSYTGTLTTPSLPTTGWYAVYVWGGSGTQRWEGRIRLEAGYDDLAATVAEALPMVHTYSTSASAGTVGDADAFQIQVPNTTTNLDIQVSGLSSATVLLYDPAGNFYTSHAITSTSTYWSIPSLPTAGHWTWVVLANTTGTYTTVAWLGCASSSPACDLSPGVRYARQSWGDRFAGRLPTSSTEHTYRITLAESQGVSVSVSDTQQPCAVELSVYGPSSGPNNMLNLGGQAIMRWTDGAAVADQGGNTAGAGGYVEALAAGDYEFRVRPVAGTTCDYYRINLATSTQRGYALPAW